MAAVAENAQQDPHEPWSLTLVTAPNSLQSIEAGAEVEALVFFALFIFGPL